MEPIAGVLGPVPPDNVLERFFPNEFDLTHPKLLIFMGVVTNISTIAPAHVDMWFDWVDPSDPTNPIKTSPIVPLDMLPGQSLPFLPGALEPIHFLIPFCPPDVSIHFQNGGQGVPVAIDGTFIHQCLIPEPATTALAGLAVLAAGVVLRRKK